VKRGRQPKECLQSDLRVADDGQAIEISNSRTAVRLPAGEWRPADTNAGMDAIVREFARHLGIAPAGDRIPGPLLGVKLASGKWDAGATVAPAAKFLGCSSAIVVQGPMFVRARVRYEFADQGEYTVDVTLRSEEPLVRVDERYTKAGALRLDLGTSLQPAQFATKADFRGNMQLTPIDYSRTNKLVSLVGWDFYLPDRTAVIGYLGGQGDDLLAWLSTDPDWLPVPYEQMLTVTAEPGPKLTAEGSLASGHRHWALLAGKRAEFPDPARDLYRWANRHIEFTLDKVAGWQLLWPDMEKIEFPHTFFSQGDLPGIRARLQAEPAIREYMENLRKSDGGYFGWSQRAGEAASSTDPSTLLGR